GVSLDSDTVIEPSKWIDLEEIKPKPDGFVGKPILGGKNGDKIIFLDESANDDIKANTFDTTLEQWEINRNVIGKPKYFSSYEKWVSDVKTGLSYAFDNIEDKMMVLDTVGLAFVNNSVSSAKDIFGDGFTIYRDYAQVMLQNGRQILY